MSILIRIHLCWICGKPVDLATCKTDEYGEAVHEACYVARIALENSARKHPASITHSDANPITWRGL